MSKMIESLKINAVDRATTENNIIKSLEKYAIVSYINFENFETIRGGKYKRAFIHIELWKNTKEATEFIQLVHNRKARLNYWWDIQDNTNQKKENLLMDILIDEAPLPMDEEYIYNDGLKIHRYEWKDVMDIIYGYGIENF